MRDAPAPKAVLGDWEQLVGASSVAVHHPKIINPSNRHFSLWFDGPYVPDLRGRADERGIHPNAYHIRSPIYHISDPNGRA
jgi:hypothetical protein